MSPAEQLLALKKAHIKDAQHTINAFCDVMERPSSLRFRFGRLSCGAFFTHADCSEDADQIDAVFKALLTRKLTQ